MQCYVIVGQKNVQEFTRLYIANAYQAGDETRGGGGGGGGGLLPASGPIREAGEGGGAFHLRPDTKSGGGGGGVLSGASGPIQKAGKGGGAV